MSIRYRLGIFVLLTVISCKSTPESTDSTLPVYPVMAVRLQDAVLQSIYPVTIRGQDDIEVKPRIEGFIEELYIEEGDNVRKGDRLFKITSPQTIQAYATAKAALSSAKAEVNIAKLDVDRMTPLARKGIISNVQLESYKNTYESELAIQAQAEANLANAAAMMEWLTVTSPVDGIIGTISFRHGSLVNSSTVLTTVSSIGNVYAYFSLNEKELLELLYALEGSSQEEKIRNIPPVTLMLANESEYSEKGVVETISGVVNITTGSANLRARFPNQRGILRSGTSGTIHIPRVLHDVFVIPQKATFDILDKTLVYKVRKDSVIQKTISVVPLPEGQDYVVTTGLAEGDTIVTDGIITLYNGKKIAIKK